jgi:hypothetical protein
MLRLLRPPPAASFLRSFRLHSPRYARETTAKNMLARGALVTASITQTGSCVKHNAMRNCVYFPQRTLKGRRAKADTEGAADLMPFGFHCHEQT